jgi:hypothetical protein
MGFFEIKKNCLFLGAKFITTKFNTCNSHINLYMAITCIAFCNTCNSHIQIFNLVIFNIHKSTSKAFGPKKKLTYFSTTIMGDFNRIRV